MIQLIQYILQMVLIIIGIIIAWLILPRIVRRIFHFPAPAFIGFFLDSNYRRKIQSPTQIIERSGIKKGDRVLEIGCGSGAYTTFVAREVGEQGIVEALDIQPAMLVQLEKKLKHPENSDIHNIRLHESNAYQLPFDDKSIDLVYMITVLPEIPDQGRVLAEVKRVLKVNGILAVTEFLPDPDYPLSSTTSRKGEEAGFDVEGVFGNLWTYTVRFRKSK
ncbi:MAG: class I SAM-dependent methyltransferase [Anaerolineales bacterium]|nr:class I SAM-dependent methyltransferase [Anaerolineales bacterium]